MTEWLQTLYDRGVLGVPGVLLQKSGSCGAGSGVPPSVPGVAEYLEETPGTPDGTPSADIKPLIYRQEHQQHPEHLQPGVLLGEWREGLAAIDPVTPRSSCPAVRWASLYDCSVWWLDHFGVQAAKDGWGTGNVFGMHPAGPGLGGLIDRFSRGHCHLRKRPGLLMTADRGCWRSYGVAQSYNRTAGAGLRPFWEIDL